MRKTRIGKRIFVQGVPLDTSWFCPYCCATVDTPSVTQGSRTQNAYVCSSPASIGYSLSAIPQKTCVSGRNHKETCAGCIFSLAILAR